MRDDELFAAVVELPPAARDAWLARACRHDPAQRARLLALLAAHEIAADFLDRSPPGLDEEFPPGPDD